MISSTVFNPLCWGENLDAVTSARIRMVAVGVKGQGSLLVLTAPLQQRRSEQAICPAAIQSSKKPKTRCSIT